MAGTMINAPALGSTGETKFVTVTETDRPLFKEVADTSCSEVFKVPNDGSGVMLTTFKLCQPLVIEMVKTNVQDMPSGQSSCCTCKVEHVMSMAPSSVEAREAVLQTADGERGLWAIGQGANMGILAVPGSYRLCAVNKCSPQDLSVCAKLVSPESMKNIPTSLIFGNN